MKYAIIALVISLILFGGCVEKESAKYFEIVKESPGSFHEIIITESGEYFEKKGTQNLGYDTQVKAGIIAGKKAAELLQKAAQMITRPDNCDARSFSDPINDIIYFDKSSITRKCFIKSQEFEGMYLESAAALQPPEAENNFFIHLIEKRGLQSFDHHLHSSGLLITTVYDKTGALSSAEIKSIPPEALNKLKSAVTTEVLKKEENCGLSDSGYLYIEIQKGGAYTYYGYCTQVSIEKQDFYSNAQKIFGEAR